MIVNCRSQSIVSGNSPVVCHLAPPLMSLTVLLNPKSTFITESTNFAIFANGTGNTCDSEALVIKYPPPFPPPPTSVTFPIDQCGIAVTKIYGAPDDPVGYMWTASMLLASYDFTTPPTKLSDVPAGARYYAFSATCLVQGHTVAGTHTGHIAPGSGDPHNPQKVVSPTDALQVVLRYQSNCANISGDTIPLGTPLVASAEFTALNQNYVMMKPDRCFFAPSQPDNIGTYTSTALDVFDDGCPTGLFGCNGLPDRFTGVRRSAKLDKFEVMFNAFSFNNKTGDGTLSGSGAYLGFFCYFTLCPATATEACTTVTPSTCWNQAGIASNTTHCPVPSQKLLVKERYEKLSTGAVRVLKKAVPRHSYDEQQHVYKGSFNGAPLSNLHTSDYH